MKKITVDQYADLITKAYENPIEIQAFEIEKTKVGRVALVLGFRKDEYDECDDYANFVIKVNDEKYALFKKVAVYRGSSNKYDEWIDVLETEEPATDEFEFEVSRINEKAEELIEEINNDDEILKNEFDDYDSNYYFTMMDEDDKVIDAKSFKTWAEMKDYYDRVWSERYSKCLDDESDEFRYEIKCGGFRLPCCFQGRLI